MTYPRWPEGPQRPIPPNCPSLVSLAIALGIGVLLWGCNDLGSESPTSPGSFDRHQLATQWGTATVEVLVPGWDGMDALEASADSGIARIAAQGYEVSLDNLLVTIESECKWVGGDCNGKTESKYHVLIVDGVERALDHELQHVACRMIYTDRRGNECCRLQDHPNGYDLNCDRI